MTRLVSGFLIFTLIAGCSDRGLYTRTFTVMGTVGRIFIAKSPGSRGTVETAIAKMKDVERIFNVYDPASEIVRVNGADPDEWIGVSNDFAAVLERSFQIHRLTDGAFDVSVGSAERAWGFYGRRRSPVPDAREIAEIKRETGMEHVSLEKRAGKYYVRRGGVRLDFNAIAKGYAVDEAVKVLRGGGIRDALVEAGGDMYCLGSPRGRGWTIGLRDPEKRHAVLASVTLSDRAIATSGGYEKFIRIKGETFAHIMDPGTAAPVRNNVLSATAVSDSCTAADALATAFFVLGPEESLRIAESSADIDCIIICEVQGEKEHYVSPGLDEAVRFSE
ncbi:MAG: FAD:protein FMN transferase [Candidatus Omnitrophota bacterium]